MSLRSLTGVVVAPPLAPAGALIGAEAGCGGWFDSAPGTPEAPPCAHFGRCARLLAANRGLLRIAVRAVVLRRLFAAREVDVGAHLRMRITGAEQRREDRVDALLRAALDLLAILQLRRVEPAAHRRLRQQIAVLVENGHALDRHFRHRRRHHMRDRKHLTFVERAARIQIDEHRRRWRFLVAHEHGWLRNRQMHARRLHRRNRFDRAFQLAFERALIVDLLGELADAELLVVHQFEADRAALRQSLRCKAQAHLMHLLGRHEDRAAGLGELVRNVRLLERRDDGAAVAVGQVAVEHLVVRRARPEEQARHDGDEQRDREDERRARVAAHLRETRQALTKIAAEAATEAAQVCIAAGLAGARRRRAGLRAGEAHAGVGVDQRVGRRIHASGFSGMPLRSAAMSRREPAGVWTETFTTEIIRTADAPDCLNRAGFPP